MNQVNKGSTGGLRNTFGTMIPDRKTIMENPRWVEYIQLTFADFLAALGCRPEIRPRLINRLMEAARADGDETWYEENAHAMLRDATSDQEWKRALGDRVGRIFNQVKAHLKPGATLDYGCGSGGVGRLIQEYQGSVTLADTYRHPDIGRIGLPFVLLEQRAPAPLPSEAYDNVFLCTVLHHCDLPLDTLSEAIRVTRRGGSLLIIESVYGVESEVISKAPPNHIVKAFAALEEEGQLAVNVFFDHIHNRCLYYSADPATKVNVPYNYQRSANWEETFARHGLKTGTVVSLGIDQPLAPLFHTLHVAVRPEDDASARHTS